METSPPSRRSESRLRIKPIYRLAQNSEEFGENLSPSPRNSQPPYHLCTHSSNNSLPLRELLLLPPSPRQKSKHRLLERLEMVEEPVDLVGSRRKCKSKTTSTGICASPRNTRRLRRRSEQENREEKDLGLGEEHVKVRKRKQSRSAASRKEKLSCNPSTTYSNLRSSDDGGSSLDSVGQLINELVMWKDVAKSSLWFGFGSLCFLSSCFTRGFNFSAISAASQVGQLFLGLSFFYNSFSQRPEEEPKKDFKLTEEDIVKVARVVLPAANAMIKKTRELFSGEPSVTLKMAPILLFASEYGHLITLWRLAATGFFMSFTLPKLYSCYSDQIRGKVENMRTSVSEAWAACSHKRFVAGSAVMAFWNLSSVKMRIFAAFISMVILRYNRRHHPVVEIEETAEGKEEEIREEQQQLALVVADAESAKDVIMLDEEHQF